MKTMKPILVCGMALSMIASSLPVSILANEPVQEKETVFVQMSDEGKVIHQSVSVHLHSDDGIGQYQQEVNLNDVKDTKTGKAYSLNGQQLRLNTQDKDVYYQGQSNQSLPVSLKVSYTLDGQPIKASEIKKSKGHLVMSIHMTNQLRKQVNINGQSITIHPLIAVAGGVAWSEDKAQNIKVSTGQNLGDSQKEMVGFVQFPGLQESLASLGLSESQVSDDIVIEADINHLDIGDVYLAMKPVDDLSTILDGRFEAKLSSQLAQMSQAQDQLVSGSEQLATALNTMDDSVSQIPVQSLAQLGTGMGQLASGGSQVQQGVQAYTGAVDQVAQQAQFDPLLKGLLGLQAASNNLAQNSGNIAAQLGQIKVQLDATKGQVDQLVGQLEAKNTALANLKATLEEKGQYDSSYDLALAPMDTSALNQLSQGLGGLSTSLDQLQGGLNKLSDGQDQVTSNLKQLSDQAGQKLNQLSDVLNKLSSQSEGLRQGSSQLNQGIQSLGSQKGKLNDLMTGLSQLQSATSQLAQGANTLKEGQQAFKHEAVDGLVSRKVALDELIKQINDYTQSVVGFSAKADQTQTSFIVKIED